MHAKDPRGFPFPPRAQKYPLNIHRLETALQQHTSIAPTGVCSAAVLPGHPAELGISFAPPQLTN